MKLLMNIIWGLFGGWWAALANVILGLICYVTIVLAPLGVISFRVANLLVAPFGKVIVSKRGGSKGGKAVAMIMNILWLPFGLINVMGTLFASLALCCTIIGIPFAMQGFKLVNYLVWPFGREAVSKDLHEARMVASELKGAAKEGLAASGEPVTENI